MSIREGKAAESDHSLLRGRRSVRVVGEKRHTVRAPIFSREVYRRGNSDVTLAAARRLSAADGKQSRQV